MNPTIDITGQRFNHLIAIEFKYKGTYGHYWLFKCDCGKEIIKIKGSVVGLKVKSCGCSRKKYDAVDKTKYPTCLSCKELTVTHKRCGNCKELVHGEYCSGECEKIGGLCGDKSLTSTS